MVNRINIHTSSLSFQIFATDTSEYAGQPVALAIADTQEHADQMAKAVNIKYEIQGKPILTISDAIKANSFYDTGETAVKIGDAEGMRVGLGNHSKYCLS